MRLTVKELKDILEIAERLEVKSVEIEIDSSSGIGSIVTASYPVVHEGFGGSFVATITGVESW